MGDSFHGVEFYSIYFERVWLDCLPSRRQVSQLRHSPHSPLSLDGPNWPNSSLILKGSRVTCSASSADSDKSSPRTVLVIIQQKRPQGNLALQNWASRCQGTGRKCIKFSWLLRYCVLQVDNEIQITLYLQHIETKWGYIIEASASFWRPSEIKITYRQYEFISFTSSLRLRGNGEIINSKARCWEIQRKNPSTT